MNIRKVDSDFNEVWNLQYPQSYYMYSPIAMSPDGQYITYQGLSSGIFIASIATSNGDVAMNATYSDLTIQTEIYEGMGASQRYSPSGDYLFFTASLKENYWSDGRLCRVPSTDYSTATCIELVDGEGSGSIAGFNTLSDSEVIINYAVGKLEFINFVSIFDLNFFINLPFKIFTT